MERKDALDDYADMLLTEQHHDHEIVMVDGLARWKENPGVREVVDMCDLNNMIEDMGEKGIGKNDERYRRLYRNMGYSLRGYWEVFYWSENNKDAEEYRPPTNEVEALKMEGSIAIVSADMASFKNISGSAEEVASRIVAGMRARPPCDGKAIP